MFRAVLFGQLSEHVRGDRANMTASLLDLLEPLLAFVVEV